MKEEPALRATATESRTRSLTGTFGPIEIAVPRARLNTRRARRRSGRARVAAYQRRTLAADALIASTYLAAPTRAGCAVRSPPCLAVRWARTR